MTNKKLANLLASLFLLGCSIVLTLKIHWADFHVYYTAGHSLLAGRTDLYAANFGDSQIMDYRYPLFFLIVFLPFCWLPYQMAELVWLWLNIGIVYLTFRAVKRCAQKILDKPVRFDLIALLAFLICARYFIVSMRILNVHVIVLSMVFGTFYLLIRQKPFGAAILMALAVTFKIFPALTLPYFALKKQWSFLLMTGFFIVAFNLAPAIYFGFDANFEMLRDWHQHVIVDNEFHNTNGPLNVSLQGQLERYLTHVDYSRRFEDPWYENVNFMSLTQNAVSVISKIISGLMATATLFLIWFFAKLRRKMFLLNENSIFDKREQRLNNRGFSTAFDTLAFHEFGLMICLTLLVEPRSNVYYFLILFFPLVPFLHSFLRDRSKINAAAFSLILILACAMPLLPGSYVQRLLLVFGVDFYIAFVLWLALGYNLIRASCKLKCYREANV